MKSLAVILLLLIPAAVTKRCYDYMNQNTLQNNLHTWIDCPYETMYCYKSYIESRDYDGQKTWIESRSCGTPNLCQREGCMGGDKDRACCCVNDLCNGAESKTVLVGSIATLLLYFLPVFH